MTLEEFLVSNPSEEEKLDHILFLIWAWCDEEDKSTEFMFQYMADIAEIAYDDAVDFVITRSDDRAAWYEKFPNWYEELKEQ